jgi:hypothetical protein
MAEQIRQQRMAELQTLQNRWHNGVLKEDKPKVMPAIFWALMFMCLVKQFLMDQLCSTPYLSWRLPWLQFIRGLVADGGMYTLYLTGLFHDAVFDNFTWSNSSCLGDGRLNWTLSTR